MDKRQFVDCLGILLANISLGITGARYDKTIWDETAVIEFDIQPPLIVNINGDSKAQVLLDVVHALEQHITF